MVVKTFVALGFIITIDDRFASTAPAEVWANARFLNSESMRKKYLQMGEDNHSYKKIWEAVTKPSSKYRIDIYFNGVLNVVINIWVAIMTNAQVIWYNYFAALSILVIQFIGY